MWSISVLVLVGFFTVGSAYLPLPPYLKACHLNSTDFDECALKQAILGLPHLLKGDRTYGIPKLDPLELEQISLDSNGHFKIDLKKVKIHGPVRANITGVKIDHKAQIFSINMTVNVLTILSKYEMSGRILVLPLEGKGDANITLKNFKWNHKIIMLLFEVYRENKENFKNGNHKVAWGKVATEMTDKGYVLNWQQCQIKMDTLKRRYKNIKDSEKSTGTSPITWEYYPIMDELFGNKKWAKPLAGAISSTEVNNSTAKIDQPKPVNIDFVYDFPYGIKTKDDGEDYVSTMEQHIDYTMERAYVNFTNLFNGNEKLGDHTNKLLNDEWKPVADELKPTIQETMKIVISSIVNGIFEKVPYRFIVL